MPNIANNVLVDNVDLYSLAAKDRGYQLIAMDMANLALACSGTALMLTNMEVTLDEVDIVGADEAIYAFNSFVDAYSSNIDGNTCKVVGDGLINIWWEMEVKTTWGDAIGLDTGTPVDKAIVVFYDANDDYYTSAYTDEMGVLAPTFYCQWMVDLGGPVSLSPYAVKIASAGATNDQSVVLNSNLVGDERVHIVLWGGGIWNGHGRVQSRSREQLVGNGTWRGRGLDPGPHRPDRRRAEHHGPGLRYRGQCRPD